MECNGDTLVNRSNGRNVGEHDDPNLPGVTEKADTWTAWAYRPHTISLLLIGACILIWASGALNPDKISDGDRVASAKRGVWAMIAVFLGYCMLQAPSTILIRPHPAIWRLVHGIAIVYLVALTFLLFQKRDDARQFMKFVHPDLGVELPERSYGADCRIYTPENPKSRFNNVYEILFDEFVIAHVLGWWGKSIMIPNQPLLWVLSIGFEMMEVTFNHLLPNFNECWWDSFILDVLICNWFGIWAGMKTVRYFDGKTYDWVGISQQSSIMGKVKWTLGQFTPAHWDKDEWYPLSGPWRFLQVLGLIIVFLTVELNAFFLKLCLWIPPHNPLNAYRLIIWWLIAVPTIREYNSYLQDRKPIKKVGAFCWLALAICIVELLICIKFGHGKVPYVLLYAFCITIVFQRCFYIPPGPSYSKRVISVSIWIRSSNYCNLIMISKLSVCDSTGLYPKLMPSWIFRFWIFFGVALVLFLMGWSLHSQRAFRGIPRTKKNYK